MSYVLLIGAYERDNFGDILFGTLFDRAFYPRPCVWGSLIGRDMRRYGGQITLSIGDALPFMRQEPPVAVVHCGGQTISVGTLGALSMDLIAGLLPLWPDRRFQPLAELIAARSRPIGYVNGPQDLFPGVSGRPPVAFISIGGTGSVARTRHLKTAFADARFISVRDYASQQFLRDLAIEANLFPDVIHALGDYFPLEELGPLHEVARRMFQRRGTYLVFQAQAHCLNRHRTLLSHEVARCARDLNASVVLQPAGTASAHDTLSSLCRLRESMNTIDPGLAVEVQADRSIWAQVATIANAACWVGTSLHGWIVATVYGRPRVTFASQKTSDYVGFWAPTAPRAELRPAGIVEAVRSACEASDEPGMTGARLATGARASVTRLMASLELAEAAPVRRSPTTFDAVTVMSAELDRLRSNIVRLWDPQSGITTK